MIFCIAQQMNVFGIQFLSSHSLFFFFLFSERLGGGGWVEEGYKRSCLSSMDTNPKRWQVLTMYRIIEILSWWQNIVLYCFPIHSSPFHMSAFSKYSCIAFDCLCDALILSRPVLLVCKKLGRLRRSEDSNPWQVFLNQNVIDFRVSKKDRPQRKLRQYASLVGSCCYKNIETASESPCSWFTLRKVASSAYLVKVFTVSAAASSLLWRSSSGIFNAVKMASAKRGRSQGLKRTADGSSFAAPVYCDSTSTPLRPTCWQAMYS